MEKVVENNKVVHLHCFPRRVGSSKYNDLDTVVLSALFLIAFLDARRYKDCRVKTYTLNLSQVKMIPSNTLNSLADENSGVGFIVI